MKVEIWSDLVCPFCYIGKRKFEIALEEFAHAPQVQIEWKSFQLNPNTITDPETSVYQHLATHKGISVDQAHQMSNQVTEMAKNVDLLYDFDKAIVANTFNAHRVLHFAKSSGLQNQTKERFLMGYFVEGKNLDKHEDLIDMGVEVGLNKVELENTLAKEHFTDEVRKDIYEAQQLRIQGVPFFVFDRKYGISGAQDPSVFLQTLEKSYSEWKNNQQEQLETIQGQSCSPEGCD